MIKQITIKDFLLFSEAWIFIAISRLILVFVPFSKILPLLGTRVAIHENTYKNENHFKHISRAITRACRYSFWRTACFEQALCAKLMLKLRNKKSTIYFGVRKEAPEKELLAHAWLICNEEIITGGKHTELYTVLSSFYS
ncbi:lasso peptide biosynthesis B2 protein [Emticicia sp. BO119]|uniref:lasso peptide biosynthesis B2 protein n=1 Tax=Emticicia sp. BO119 TaxID=2757768 RepID=UPI0015F10358|nr:lasso peptide biosynthesis B2 protein [Emticicia sp. BO119]MBA4853991.1 lasso peptide biosynthesis B2 protein [Emticicia sp. BO119]